MKPEIPTQSVGFKEWAYVCDSLVQGVQTLILRKGGIHEGRGGFEWKHRQFFLFPTWFHTQSERLTWSPENTSPFPPEEERTSVEIDGYATMEQVWKVTDWAQMEAIASFHIWKEEIVKERFVYDDESCLHVALVRAYKLPERWAFPYAKGYGGCRSWVNLPEDGMSLIDRASAAIGDDSWQQTAGRLRSILG
ncbi:DUF1802 family protein [Prosthecobacter sp. SYSU 5D2]|uniref:DUF1802 family protein n=1 Tax=Prosthecobacter sp. SYSU 5D2 TaxID=3134134 RepID=UPI0031FEE75B